MTPSHRHDPTEPHHATHAIRAGSAKRPGAVVVPFPVPGARPTRRAPGADERRGEILLFLGVRYERLAS